MAYEALKIGSEVSRRLAANRAADELNWRGRPTVSAAAGLRLDAGRGAAKASSAPRATARPAGRYTQTDIDRAVKAAVHSERCRVANVFGSQASQGRERICAKLLAHPAGWASSFIIAELPNLAGGNAAKPSPKASTKAQASNPAPATSAADIWDGVWDRALGKSTGPETEASQAWDRAYDALRKRA